MAGYPCERCQIDWPHLLAYRICPKCGTSLRYESDVEPLTPLEAGKLVQQIEFDRLCDEHIVTTFLASMEATLGPSTEK